MNEADINDKLRQAITTHTRNRETVAALLGQVIRQDNLLLIEQEKISTYMVILLQHSYTRFQCQGYTSTSHKARA